MCSNAYIVQRERPLLFRSWMSLMSLSSVLVVKSVVREDMYEAYFWLPACRYTLKQAPVHHMCTHEHVGQTRNVGRIVLAPAKAGR